MTGPVLRARRIRRLLFAAATVLVVLFGLAAPASAATVGGGGLTIKQLSNGALELDYNGHAYICYSGDLCVYRGKYQTYYVCQSTSNSYDSDGWSVNNQTGSGGVARFYGRNGAANWDQPIHTAYVIHWHYVSSIRTCT